MSYVTRLIVAFTILTGFAAQVSAVEDAAPLTQQTLEALLAAPEGASVDSVPDDMLMGCGNQGCLFDTCGCWEQCIITVCTSCGDTWGAACLDGDEPSACRDDWTQNVLGICTPCGDQLEPICFDGENPNCMSGMEDILGVCTVCGDPGEPVCPSGGCRGWSQEVLGICTACGDNLQPVCLDGDNPSCMDGYNDVLGICTACGGFGQPACFNDPEPCSGDDPNDSFAGLCVQGLCGGDGQLTCEFPGVPRCDAGLTAWDTTPVRPFIESNLIDPVLDGNDLIIDVLESLGFNVTQAVDNADVCIDATAADFTPEFPLDGWTDDEVERGPRTVFWLHGLGGGGYNADGGFNQFPEEFQNYAASNRLVYSVDYNSAGAQDGSGNFYPMRVFAQDALGNSYVAYEGATPIDGTNFTFTDVADFVRDAATVLPIEGELMVVAVSLGGYTARELVFRHYDELRYRGTPIAQVHYFGHPHLGFLMEPLDGIASACSSIGIATAVGIDENELVQLCNANRWLLGWDEASGLNLDETDYPQIRWTNSWGSQGGGAFVYPPFSGELIGVDLNTVDGDGVVPSASAAGLDVLDSFAVDDITFDLNVGGGCQHTDYNCYLADLALADPMNFTDEAVCGDLDGAGTVDSVDIDAVRDHLSGSALLDGDALTRCDVGGDDGACSILDAVLMSLSTQTPPRPPGLAQRCVAADDLTRQLAVYWPFEGSGADAKNAAASCSRMDGAFAGNTGRVPGVVGGAVSFDGSGDSIQVTSLAALEALTIRNRLSFAAWILPQGSGSGGSGGGILLNKEGEYELARFSDGSIRWAINIGGWSWQDTGVTAPLGEWTHIALVMDTDAGFIELYKNGVLQNTQTLAGILTDGESADEFWIGGREAHDQFFNGAMDEVGFWTRALSAREVASLYAGGAGQMIDTGALCLTQPVFLEGEFGLSGTFSFDLDTGTQVTSVPEAEVFWRRQTSTEAYFVPRNGALLGVAGSAMPDFEACVALPKADADIDLSTVAIGDWLCALTTDGRIARFTALDANAAVLNEASFMTIGFTTWDN